MSPMSSVFVHLNRNLTEVGLKFDVDDSDVVSVSVTVLRNEELPYKLVKDSAIVGLFIVAAS